MDMNAESILDALNDFERKPLDIPPILEDYLLRIAQNGEIIFPWSKLKPLLKRKLEVVLDEFYESCPVEIAVPVPNFDTFNYDSLKKSIIQAVDGFTSAPFTIQRICELVTNPKKHYNRTDKYMRGIEKNVLVVSTIEPRIGVQNDANANVNPIVNGMINDSPRDDNDCFNNHENNENVSSSDLNTPANHVLLDNFANVFPSAACIPSPSNICMNRELDSINNVDREIDSNFISNSECVETQEVEFTPQVSLEPTESVQLKDEQMDTNTEESSSYQNDSDNDVESTEAEQNTENNDNSTKSDPEEQVEKVESLSDEISESASSSEVNASEALKNEADCSESDSYVIPSEEDKLLVEGLILNQCQQDDTVSQSDENALNIGEVSESAETCDTSEISSNEEFSDTNDDSSEISQSTINNDSNSMDCPDESLNSEEPSV